MKEDITLSDFCMISYTGKIWTEEEWRNGGNEKTKRERERERERDLREGRRKCLE